MTSDISRRTVLAGIGGLSLAAALSNTFTASAQTLKTSTPSSLAALRSRWVDQLTGRTTVKAADPDFALAISKLDAAVTASSALLVTVVAPAERAAVFSDAPLTVDSAIVTTFKRLAQMATAWATPTSQFLGDSALLSDILLGLADANRLVYNTTQAEFGNWWSWEIGSPKALSDTMVIVYEHLTPEQITAYTTAIDHFVPDPYFQFPDSRGKIVSVGANRVDLCQAVIIRSLVGEDVPRLTHAVAGLSQVWQYVTSDNGFFRDGSFIQHSTIAYTGTYGVVLLSGLARLFALLGGSDQAVSDPSRQILFDAVQGSFAPFVYNGAMMDSVRGRAVSRVQENSHDDGNLTIEAILLLAQGVDAATAKQWRRMCTGWIARNDYESILQTTSVPRIALVKELLASGVGTAREPLGHRFFPSMDRSVHRGHEWALTLAMSSERITWYECGNGENDKGYFTGSGMTYLYDHDGGQFDDDFWPTANLYRLPGITVDTTPLPDKVEGQWGNNTPQGEWTGGATTEKRAIIGQHLIGPGATGLSARKSWIFCDDIVVALGADIHTASGNTVESIVEHRNLHADGDNTITVDGHERGTVVGSEEVVPGAKWAHVEDVGGYLVADGASLKVVREARTGTWHNINAKGPTDPITRNFATLWFDHGANPAAASYAYAILPGYSPKETAKAARRGPFEVVRNDAIAQAVRFRRHEFMAVNFWAAGEVDRISCASAASLMVGVVDDGLELVIADPTQKAASITLTLNVGKVKRIRSKAAVTMTRGPGRSTVLTIPTAGLAGGSVTVMLETSDHDRD